MKKLTIIFIVVAGVICVTAFMNKPGSPRAVQSKKPIPNSVLMIIEKSCINCHVEPGKKLALAHVNLSRWDRYKAEKQANKSKDMCRMVSKGKMPPKGFKEKNPGFVITKEEIKTICDWSASIQVTKQ
jgi:hypothetical protein